MNSYDLVTQSQPTFYFIGVTTASSSIMRVFPLWMKALGRPDVQIVGVDYKIHDAPAVYRSVVEHIRRDPLSLGALVTTHKIDLLAAARDLFDDLDPYARLTHEVSSISKRGERLRGHAKDPISAGKSIDAILEPGYFGQTGADVLCYGAGGAGTAIALHFMGKTSAADRPLQLTLTDCRPDRLEEIISLTSELRPQFAVHTAATREQGVSDRLLEQLPERSLVINATGMGKDTPGSPISDAAVFPRNCIVWELNYRGELDFMQQASAQRDDRGLRIEDGWLYFLHGWTQVIAEVLDVPIEGAIFVELAAIAAQTRGK